MTPQTAKIIEMAEIFRDNGREQEFERYVKNQEEVKMLEFSYGEFNEAECDGCGAD